MDLIGIQNQLDTTVGAVAAIVAHYPRHPDAIASTPASVIGNPKGHVTPGNRQVTELEIPIRVYVERVADDARTSAAAIPIANAVVVALAAVSTASGLWSVITGIDLDTDLKAQIGDAFYWTVELVVHMSISEAATYAAI